MDFYINLQLFGDEEKTEEPTAKKRKDAKEEGQILQSKEVNSVVILFSAIMGFKVFGKFIIENLAKFMVDIFSSINDTNMLLGENNINAVFLKIMGIIVITSAPILIATFVSSLLINYLQVGFVFNTKSIELKLDKLNPVEGFKRMFSKKSLVELVKSILKVALSGYFAYAYAYKQMNRIVTYVNMSTMEYLKDFSQLLYEFSIRVIGTLFILSLFDFFFQWREHENKLKMSKQEVKEEYKQSEGDPALKSKIKEKQRQMAMSRMMQDVPQADVIITNPTHFAVALKYDGDKYDAPYLLAKGVDLIAENIKKIAIENEVPMVENVQLARTIYSEVEIGDVIPEELYEVVAEVLAYIYSLENDK